MHPEARLSESLNMGSIETYPNETHMPDETGRSKPIVYMLDPCHPRAVGSLSFDRSQRPSNYGLEAKGSQRRMTAGDINGAKYLRAIGKQGVGIDDIDQAARAVRMMKILNTPGINKGAVAELTLGLALAVARDFGPVTRKQAAGITVAKKMCSGLLLSGKVVGIIGMGNIGTAVARAFRGALGVSLIAYGPYVPSTARNDIPHTPVGNLDELLCEADGVTLHCPLKDDTRNMISYREVCLVKPTAILTNATRGGAVNEDDLLRALQERKIFGAGVDVYIQEPPTRER